jgi:hypothetical protein
VPENASGQSGRAPDSYDKQLLDLREAILEQGWPDKTKLTGLLNDANLKPKDYPLDGGANTLWANLIPFLKGRGELAQVLRVLQPHVGEMWEATVAELANYFERQAHELADELAYSRMRTQLREDTEAALARLWDAPNHQATLLMPVHPSAARLAGMRSWITGCARAVVKAQKTGAEVSHEDEAAELVQWATQLAAVSDAFRLYESMLEKARSAHGAEPGQQGRPLAAAAEEEQLLLGWRMSLRASIQQLIAVLRSES